MMSPTDPARRCARGAPPLTRQLLRRRAQTSSLAPTRRKYFACQSSPSPASLHQHRCCRWPDLQMLWGMRALSRERCRAAEARREASPRLRTPQAFQCKRAAGVRRAHTRRMAPGAACGHRSGSARNTVRASGGLGGRGKGWPTLPAQRQSPEGPSRRRQDAADGLEIGCRPKTAAERFHEECSEAMLDSKLRKSQ